MAVLTAFGFFGSILLHELGHALAARREGIEVSGIDLFFFGGVMKMSRDTTSPGQEFRVAVAGPAGDAADRDRRRAGRDGAARLPTASGTPRRLERTGADSAFELWLSFLVSANVLLLRVQPRSRRSRSTAAGSPARRRGRSPATAARRRALSAYLGQAFAALLIGYGLYLLFTDDDTVGGLWAIVLGYLLGSSARAAIAAVGVHRAAQGRHRRRHHGLRAGGRSRPTCRPREPGRSSSCATRAGRGSRSWRPTGATPASPTAPPSSTPPTQKTGDVPVRDIAAGRDDRVRADAPLEALLGSEALRRVGALMAVDAEGRLRGVVTMEQVTRALQTRLSTA